MRFDLNKNYGVDAGDLNKLCHVLNLLYREKPLSGDERRDAAHKVKLFLDSVVET